MQWIIKPNKTTPKKVHASCNKTVIICVHS